MGGIRTSIDPAQRTDSRVAVSEKAVPDPSCPLPRQGEGDRGRGWLGGPVQVVDVETDVANGRLKLSRGCRARLEAVLGGRF